MSLIGNVVHIDNLITINQVDFIPVPSEAQKQSS